MLTSTEKLEEPSIGAPELAENEIVAVDRSRGQRIARDHDIEACRSLHVESNARDHWRQAWHYYLHRRMWDRQNILASIRQTNYLDGNCSRNRSLLDAEWRDSLAAGGNCEFQCPALIGRSRIREHD